MRLLLTLLLVFCPITVAAQSSPEWRRVYTFDESWIDMNTALVTRIDKDVTRLRFRWVFDNPATENGLKYQSRLEVMEFNCPRFEYRMYHLTFLDAAGNIVQIRDAPDEWRRVVSGGMMEKLFVPGCELIKEKTNPPKNTEETAQLERVGQYVFDVWKQLEQTKDFKIVIDRFFAPEYLNGYLHDEQTNWFFNLNRDTANKATPKDLERFYVASMNSGYLGSLYLITQLPSNVSPRGEIIPPDVVRLLNNHPYALKYQTKKGDYAFLADPVDDVERLRSFTDLLERVGSLMRAHVKNVKAEQNANWKEITEDSNLGQPKLRVCAKDCLGLPKGTNIFDVDIPIFHLQVAEIDAKLQIVSATVRN